MRAPPPGHRPIQAPVHPDSQACWRQGGINVHRVLRFRSPSGLGCCWSGLRGRVFRAEVRSSLISRVAGGAGQAARPGWQARASRSSPGMGGTPLISGEYLSWYVPIVTTAFFSVSSWSFAYLVQCMRSGCVEKRLPSPNGLWVEEVRRCGHIEKKINRNKASRHQAEVTSRAEP